MIDSTRLINWYNFQAPFYHMWRDNYRSLLVRRVAAMLTDNQQPKIVLDAACGSGLFTIGLAMLCKQDCFVGLDRSLGMIHVAVRKARRYCLQHVAFHLGDVHTMPFCDACFDAVVVAGLFPNIHDWLLVLREFHRVLKSGGQLVIVEFDRMAMSRLGHLFFRVMISVYKLVSHYFRQFRFAEDWNMETSTVDEQALTKSLLAEGYDLAPIERLANHMVLSCRKGSQHAAIPSR
jgi:ubiquinone/menaquinone biosynthesis C-methylase UbiE